MKFVIGLAMCTLGYALLYSGVSQGISQGHGTTFGESIGIGNLSIGMDSLTGDSATPTNNANLSGNTPQTGTPQAPVFV